LTYPVLDGLKKIINPGNSLANTRQGTGENVNEKRTGLIKFMLNPRSTCNSPFLKGCILSLKYLFYISSGNPQVTMIDRIISTRSFEVLFKELAVASFLKFTLHKKVIMV